ncbi:NADH-quinone oxidoreductase subunit C [Streptomyces sp. NPDC002018]|uniref:NADH-quinone oxidoreductase subunit C n=1 Tax=Streptomyces sp. NPDC002018 TaxID=3364629 RepID=UPI003686ED37
MTGPDLTAGGRNGDGGPAYDRLPDAVAEIFGPDATAERAYDLLTVDVPATSWTDALETARDRLGCTYFDWLSAVDEPGTGFRVCAHVAALGGGTVRRLLIRTTVPHESAVLPTAVGVYAGAGWHERETHEMFGVSFTDHPNLVPLLLPETFEGHPLRKDFVLAARVAKAWPGAKEPGESDHGGPRRRQMLPPGVPDPNEWGPLKGQLPPAPARPARGARAAGDRPVRRTRSASEGSASRPAGTEGGGNGTEGAGNGPTEPTPPTGGTGPAAGSGAAPPRTPPGAGPARRSRGVGEGSASQRRETPPPSAPDAPWHKPRPAFDDDRATGADRATEADETAPDTAQPGAEPPDKAVPGEAAPGKGGAADRPESDGPESDGPESDGPDTQGSRRNGPESDRPENDRPESDRPESDRPEGDA